MKKAKILGVLVPFLPLLLLGCGSGSALVTEEKCDKIVELLDESYEGAPARIEAVIGTRPTKVSSEAEFDPMMEPGINAEIYVWEDAQSAVDAILKRNAESGEFVDYEVGCKF